MRRIGFIRGANPAFTQIDRAQNQFVYLWVEVFISLLAQYLLYMIIIRAWGDYGFKFSLIFCQFKFESDLANAIQADGYAVHSASHAL